MSLKQNSFFQPSNLKQQNSLLFGKQNFKRFSFQQKTIHFNQNENQTILNDEKKLIKKPQKDFTNFSFSIHEENNNNNGDNNNENQQNQLNSKSNIILNIIENELKK